jgi:hypothetical protein
MRESDSSDSESKDTKEPLPAAVIVVDLIRRTLAKQANEVIHISTVSFRPNVIGIVGRNTLERDQGEKTLLGEELHHFTQLKRVT